METEEKSFRNECLRENNIYPCTCKIQRHLEDSHCRLKMTEYLLTAAYKKIHGILQSVQLNNIHPHGYFPGPSFTNSDGSGIGFSVVKLFVRIRHLFSCNRMIPTTHFMLIYCCLILVFQS